MLRYNCGCLIGSLVNRAQGYKRLREDVGMSSKYSLSEKGSMRNPKYFLVTKNAVARNPSLNTPKTLKVGSLVVLEKAGSHFHDVKEVDLELKTNSPEEVVFRCPSDSLIEIDRKMWSLIAAVPSPIDKINIAKEPRLCKELSSIEVGSVVKLSSSSSVGTVTFKGPVEGLLPGIHFQVKLIDDKHNDLSGNCRKKYYTAAELRLHSTYQSNNRGSAISRDDVTSHNDQYYSESELMKLQEKLNGDLKPFKNQLKAGDRVIWTSESGEQPGSICWLGPVEANARVHLGRNECKEVHCSRNYSTLLPVSQLISEDEYSRKKQTRSSSQLPEKYSTSSPEVPVEDLLGITGQVDLLGLTDEVDNYSAFGSSCNIMKELREEEKYYKNEKNSSLYNDFSKYGSSPVSNESSCSDELGVGSVVEVNIRGEKRYGVIKWIGSVPSYGDQAIKQEMAGIELEEENDVGTNGWLRDRKYFDCAPKRGYFCLLNNCRKDSRFVDSSFSYSGDTKIPADLGCAVIPGIVEPVNPIDTVHELSGKYKGIQGHNNSCYLDATLFSMFTFTSVFDSLLLRPPNKSDSSSYEEVQRVLREEIVNPLRKNFFVRADRVMNLRTLLDNLTSVTGLTCEEKDPEEFLTSLIAQVLKAEPFLKLSSGHEAYYYQLFVEKDERLVLPTVQQLFEQSLITSDIKLKEVPSCLIIQMPRFGKSYKMYPRILPSQVLDVTNVIENSPRECVICGKLAEYECKDCFKHYDDDRRYYPCCHECIEVVHKHEDRLNHKWSRIHVPDEYFEQNNTSTPRHYMELFAVLCIETSHYVAFVKCGMGPDTPWCFFDSMADRKGGLNGYNIPEVVLCPDLPVWLSDEGARSFCEIKDDRHLPTYAKRLLCDAYMCMYQSTDIMMYR